MADDSLIRTRPRSPSEVIRDLRENPTGVPKKPAVENADGLAAAELPGAEDFGGEFFDPTSRDYKAFGWAGNKTLPSLRFILKDGRQPCGFYHHLDSRYPDGCEFIPSAPGKGNVIRLRYVGASSAFSVTLEGRNLRRGWELIVSHSTPWVREYPSDMDTLGDAAIVVNAINFHAEK